MSQYIVSARKYRPDSFGTLVGQDNIARTLKNSILRGQLAHAYLFCGPRGVGKTTTAINLSACLAAEGKRVLAIDADQQGNTTSGLGLDKNGVPLTIYDIFLGVKPILFLQHADCPPHR